MAALLTHQPLLTNLVTKRAGCRSCESLKNGPHLVNSLGITNDSPHLLNTVSLPMNYIYHSFLTYF